jgi:DNA gyrase/topoisomerase IV subunit A
MAKKKKEEVEQVVDKSELYECTVEKVLHDSMIPYSEHVIMERALPRVEDGLKPVQRRVLYTMHMLGITHDKDFVKSARVVGDCLGKYHPHGDSSVYDAMVRLAQDFNIRIPLVEGQGNYGSLDGDGAAAMRYTEARLAPIAEKMLEDLDKDTVKMVLNFDDSREEPDLLPGKFPNLFVNGSTGIAVGVSTNIPTHNLGEMIDAIAAYIDNPKITLDELMQYVPAPDFPTGASIIYTEGIKEAYETGKGKIVMRAKTHIEKEGERENIIVTEIPYQVNKADLLVRINELRETKKDLYGDITDINDESNRKGIRCVIKLRKGANSKRILAGLYKSTELETAFNANMLAISKGKPEQITLPGYIEEYVEFQREVLYRKSQYDLTVNTNRAHILEGLLIAVNNIRRVVDIVLESPTYAESKQKLIAEFNLTDVQATAVLDIPLKRLNRLDVTSMQNELADKKKKIAELESLLASKKKQLNIVKKELLEVKEKYATPRLTEIIRPDNTTIVAQEIIEPVSVSGYLLLSHNGTLRFINEKSYNAASKNIVNCSANELVKIAKKVDSKTNIIAFTKKGLAVVFTPDMVQDDKWKSRGTQVNKLGKVDSDDSIVSIMTEKDLKDKSLYFMTKDGMIKKSAASEYSMDKKATYPSIVLKDEDDLVINVQVVDPECEFVVFVTEMGNVLQAYSNDIPEQGRRSSGVKGIKLVDKDSVRFATQNNAEGELVCVLASGFSKRVILATIDPKNRYGKGVTLCDVKKPKEIAYIDLVKEPFDFAIYFADGELIAVNTEDIDIEQRTSKGKNILKKLGPKGKFESMIYSVASHNLIK